MTSQCKSSESRFEPAASESEIFMVIVYTQSHSGDMLVGGVCVAVELLEDLQDYLCDGVVLAPPGDRHCRQDKTCSMISTSGPP
jgi:hypothetical protein